jgi:hypothetical protein
MLNLRACRESLFQLLYLIEKAPLPGADGPGSHVVDGRILERDGVNGVHQGHGHHFTIPEMY